MAARNGWKPGQAFAALFVVVFVTGEICLSLFANRILTGPFAHHWTMFNSIRLYREVTVEMQDGSVKAIPWKRFVHYNRHGVDYETRLPKHICQHIPDAKSVRIWISMDRVVTAPCRS
jgi:hypothetical protein